MALFDYGPGLAVAQGMNVGFNSVGQSIQNDRMRQMVDEWNANENLRNLQRRGLEQQAATMNELNQDAFDHLNALRGKQGALLSGVPTAYMDVLNTTQPLPQGMTRRLSSDQKTIEIVDPTGQIRGTTPNLTGQAAYDAVLRRGLNLASQAQILPQREMQEAQMYQQLELEKMKLAQQAMFMQARLAGHGSGGSGGGAGGLDKSPFSKQSPDAYVDSVIALTGAGATLPRTQNGRFDFNAFTPEQMQVYQATRQRVLREVGTNPTMNPFNMALGIPMLMDAETAAATAKKAKEDAAKNNKPSPKSSTTPKLIDPDLQKRQDVAKQRRNAMGDWFENMWRWGLRGPRDN